MVNTRFSDHIRVNSHPERLRLALVDNLRERVRIAHLSRPRASGFRFSCSVHDPLTSIETVFQASLADKMLAHGIVWGSGAGGFHEDAVYIPQPMNGDTVAELQIGVPYRTWDGTVLNAP